MHSLEKKMVEILRELAANHGVTAVKSAMEAEGIRLNELLRIKELVLRAGVGMTVKIGGCEALTDLRLVQTIGGDNIMGPMIESRFALEKFLDMCEGEYDAEELADVKLLINIETLDAAEKIDSILAADGLERLHGIVLGRTDLCHAMKVQDLNDPQVLALARTLFEKAQAKNVRCLVGGGVTPASVPFLEALAGVLDGFETRKVVFGNYQAATRPMAEGIRLALEFEYNWYEWKKQHYSRLSGEDDGKMRGLAKQLGL